MRGLGRWGVAGAWGGSPRCVKVGLTAVVDGFHVGVGGQRRQGWRPGDAGQAPSVLGGQAFPGQDGVCVLGQGAPGHRAQGRRGQCVGRGR